MPKYPAPTTPDTLPLYIARKLDALGSFPNEEGLDAIRVLLYTHQEERVVSDEELQEWKKWEKKILETQNTYKKYTESAKRIVCYLIPFILLCILPVLFSIRVLRSMLAAECPLNPFTLFDRWPIDLIVVFIHLFYFHGSELGLKLGTPTPVQPEVAENEEDDDDDWEGSMTSTELQSRQKALVGKWETILKEGSKLLESSGWIFFAQFLIIIYFCVHGGLILKRKPFRLPLPTGEYSLLIAELIFTFLIPFFTFSQFLLE